MSGRGGKAALFILMFAQRGTRMKVRATNVGATAPGQPIHPNTVSPEAEGETSALSVDLSPEQTLSAAADTAQIVNAVLEPKDDNYYVHHWGINE